MGSYRHMVLEVFLDEKYNKSVDVFSFHMILYEMFEGAPPFKEQAAYDATELAAEEDCRLDMRSKIYPPGMEVQKGRKKRQMLLGSQLPKGCTFLKCSKSRPSPCSYRLWGHESPGQSIPIEASSSCVSVLSHNVLQDAIQHEEPTSTAITVCIRNVHCGHSVRL